MIGGRKVRSGSRATKLRLSKKSPLNIPIADVGADIDLRRCGPEAVLSRVSWMLTDANHFRPCYDDWLSCPVQPRSLLRQDACYGRFDCSLCDCHRCALTHMAAPLYRAFLGPRT